MKSPCLKEPIPHTKFWVNPIPSGRIFSKSSLGNLRTNTGQIPSQRTTMTIELRYTSALDDGHFLRYVRTSAETILSLEKAVQRCIYGRKLRVDLIEKEAPSNGLLITYRIVVHCRELSL